MLTRYHLPDIQKMPYLPYEEPGITVILALTSFIVLLNVARYIPRSPHPLRYHWRIGIICGLPIGGTAWLSLDLPESIQALGFLGLIGLVGVPGRARNGH